MCVRHTCRCFFHAPPPTPIYPLSLHDALPIYPRASCVGAVFEFGRHETMQIGDILDRAAIAARASAPNKRQARSEEHTSELQSRENLVCRLLLEKKNTGN